ncbi:hypothetical protein [Aquaspirillum soli]
MDDFDASFAEFSGGDDQPADDLAVDSAGVQPTEVAVQPATSVENIDDKAQEEKFNAALAEVQLKQERMNAMQGVIARPAVQPSVPPVASTNTPSHGSPTLATPPALPIAQSQEGVVPVGMTPEEWERVKLDLPETAKILMKAQEGFRDALLRDSAAIAQQAADEAAQRAAIPALQLQQEELRKTQIAALEAVHPDWVQTVNTSDFRLWLSSQPPRIQSIIESDDPRESAWLLTQFKSQHQVARAAVTDERKRKLQSGTAISTRRPPPVVSGVPDDFDAAFNFYASRV